MRQLMAGLLVLGLTALPTRAEEKPAPTGFPALKKEFENAQKQFVDAQKEASKAFQDAKTDEEKAAARKKVQELFTNSPTLTFAPRFLEFAEKNLKDPSAVEAVVLALRISGGAQNKNGIWTKAVALLQSDFVTSPAIKPALPVLAHANDEASDKLIRDVLAKNSDRKVQASACKTLASARENAVQMGERLKSNEAFRASYEKQMGAAKVATLIANVEKNKTEGEELRKLLQDKYSDVFPDLSIGKKVPEVVIKGLDDKEARLSALKGKVVVLDIWATWCPPCRAMIPHEREMVERLKDKPFALISVSADAEKKTLTDFLATEKMPWTHWWNGAEGGILEDWDVQFFPTIYVIDAKGVIRHKGLRGEKLEEAVNELLKEAQDQK